MWFEALLLLSCFIPHTHFILCDYLQDVSKPSTIHAMPQCCLMSVYQLCLFQSLFPENMIVIKVCIKNWKRIFHPALLWVASGMRGIASLHGDFKAAPRTIGYSSGSDHLFPDFAASLLIFQRLLVSSLPSLPGDFCEIDSRKQTLI